MDQYFKEDVMQDLMADSPNTSADGFEDDAYDDSFDDGFEEDSMDDEMSSGADEYDDFFEQDGFDQDGFDDAAEDDFSDEFSEEAVDEIDALDAMEEAVADALDAEDADEFFSRLISGIRNVAGVVRRGAATAGRIAGTARRVAGQVGGVARQVQNITDTLSQAGQPRRRRRGRGVPPRPATRTAPSGGGDNLSLLLRQIVPILQRHAAQGADEFEAFEDLADLFEQEDADAALPVIAGVAARMALRPLARQGAAALGRGASRQLVRGAVQGARRLIARQGPQGVRALSPIARSVGRTAVRRGMRANVLSSAIRQTAARVSTQPALIRRLSQPASLPVAGGGGAARGRIVVRGGAPRRFVVNGPVEIIVRR